jgi:DNA-binding XRE family transcriptional regulator
MKINPVELRDTMYRRVKEHILDCSYNYNELQKLSGINRGILHKIANGKYRPTIEQLYIYAEQLNIL